MTTQVRPLLSAGDAAFRSGDRALLKTVPTDLNGGVEMGKADKKKSIVSHLDVAGHTRHCKLSLLKLPLKHHNSSTYLPQPFSNPHLVSATLPSL